MTVFEGAALTSGATSGERCFFIALNEITGKFIS
jgi:hypothetical protein